MNHSTHRSGYSIIELRNGQNKKKIGLTTFLSGRKVHRIVDQNPQNFGCCENNLGFGFWSCRPSASSANQAFSFKFRSRTFSVLLIGQKYPWVLGFGIRLFQLAFVPVVAHQHFRIRICNCLHKFRLELGNCLQLECGRKLQAKYKLRPDFFPSLIQ